MDDIPQHEPMSPRRRLFVIVYMGVFFGAAVAELVDAQPAIVAAVGVGVGLAIMLLMSLLLKKHPRQ